MPSLGSGAQALSWGRGGEEGCHLEAHVRVSCEKNEACDLSPRKTPLVTRCVLWQGVFSSASKDSLACGGHLAEVERWMVGPCWPRWRGLCVSWVVQGHPLVSPLLGHTVHGSAPDPLSPFLWPVGSGREEAAEAVSSAESVVWHPLGVQHAGAVPAGS